MDRPISRIAEVNKNHIQYDKYWQEPAITEKCVNANISLLDISGSPSIYIGFAWATYIDFILKGLTEASTFIELHEAYQDIAYHLNIRTGNRKYNIVTSCQHIDADKNTSLFGKLGVTDLYWSHKKAGQDLLGGIKVHPLPLFALLRPDNSHTAALNPSKAEEIEKLVQRKRLLCSFVGATSLPGYPSNIRERICNELHGLPRTKVQSRDTWHLQREVYEKQISKEQSSEDMRDRDKENDYKNVLSESLFSLCPSGTGPNTIRLWESIQFVSIPVILSNHWDPPGPKKLWEEACIFRDEYDSPLDVWKFLAVLSRDKHAIIKKIQALLDLKAYYSHDFIGVDIARFLLSPFNSSKALTCKNLLTEKSQYNSQKTSITTESGRKVKFDTTKFHRSPFGYSDLWPYLNIYFRSGGFQFESFSSDEAINASGSDFLFATSMLSPEQTKQIKSIEDQLIWHISEEPLWDILYNVRKDLIENSSSKNNGSSYSGYLSNLFEGLPVPYFLLTDVKYIVEYIKRLSYILKSHTATDLLEMWKRRRYHFFALCEYREGPNWEGRLKCGDGITTTVLCNRRTSLCQLLRPYSHIFIDGHGWNASTNRRQLLPDWHINKLGHSELSLLVSAIENADHYTYITEKPFDALAMLSIPVVDWNPNSVGHKYFLEGSYLNIHGSSVEEAAIKILEFSPTIESARSYLNTCQLILNSLNSYQCLSKSKRMLARRLWIEFSNFWQTSTLSISANQSSGTVSISRPPAGIERLPSIDRAKHYNQSAPIGFMQRMDYRLKCWYRGFDPLTEPDRQSRRLFLASLVDKTNMHAYITEISQRLPIRYAVVERAEDINFASLPDKVVIKPSNSAHGRGVMVFAGGQELLSGENVSPSQRLAHVISVCTRERIFENSDTRLIAEEFVQDYDPAFVIPRDFKVFVSGGQVRLIQVIDRNHEKKLITTSFFDRNWCFIEEPIKTNLRMGPRYPRPPQLEALLISAERIAKDLGVFYRLDYYLTDMGPVFGEFTSYPSAGLHFTAFGDQLMCQLMDLSSDLDLG